MNTDIARGLMGFSETEVLNKDDLRKRFRKLSLKYHPDKGGNIDMFQKINTAYRILNGDETPANITTVDELFSKKFSGFDSIFTTFNGKTKEKNKQKKKIINLTVTELFYGAHRSMEFIQKSVCSLCKGEYSKSNKMCGKCTNSGYEYDKIKRTIRIPKGIKNNAKIIVGDNTETPLELVIHHPKKTNHDWKGWNINYDTNHLEIDYTIDLKDALAGCVVNIPHPNGNDIELNIPFGIQPNEVITLKDKGLPSCPELKMPPTNANIKVSVLIPTLEVTKRVEICRLLS